MEKKKLFYALFLETKVKEVHLLVETVVDETPNRKEVCDIVDVPYNSETMKHCSREVFAQRVTSALKSKIWAPLFKGRKGGIL